ncbi:MAG TPA: hypothetical protein VGJ16_12230 [Pirellulales bacterium]
MALALFALAMVGTSRLNAIESLDAAGVQAEWQRMVAQRDLERAEDQVSRAQLELQAAQQAFDQFVREHFEELSQRPAKQPSEPASRTPKAIAKEFNPERERLSHQLDELVAKRDLLLESLTSVHPEVQDAESRIGGVMKRLQAAATGEDIPAGTPELPEGNGIEKRLSPALQSDLRRYEELAARVEEAQRDLDHALETKERASRELASLPGAIPPQAVVSKSSDMPAKRSVAQPAVTIPQTATLEIQHGSQPLALAALLIALAVAALAAVRLARASGDAVLGSVDEIAAVLALPVVGIISADRPLVAMLSPLGRARRGLVISAQAFVAIALFALVAYIVQDPAAVWNALAHPADWLERLSGFRR